MTSGSTSSPTVSPRTAGRRRRRRERRNGEEDHRERRRDDKLEGVQVKIPTFMGMNNPEAYMEWDMKVEQVFDCHNYSEDKKVKVAIFVFGPRALKWVIVWDKSA
ncbi:hypothetical protein Lal_00043531 [Lupinus albus]|nr:hypothetical protein Lal_00043531 [Lupinus albus]